MKSIIILGIAFIFLLIPPAYGSHTCSHSSYTLTDSKAINVGRASEYTYYFSVEKGDYVAIDLQVTGGRDNDVYITVQNSRGEVGNQGMVENSIQLERFTALYSGQYRLVLGNEHSLIHGKSVGLEIKITRNFDQLDMERICDIERELAKIVEDYYGIACQFNRNLWDVSTQPISVKPTSEIVCGSGTVEKNGQCIVDPNHQSLEKLQTKPSLGGGCLIATATYGSELAPQVQQLREIRDNSLLQTQSGSSFMRTFNDFYYSFSPIIADYERENPIFKEAVKMSITPMISSLSLLNHVNMDSESEVLGYGIALIMLNGMIYLGIPASMIVLVRKF